MLLTQLTRLTGLTRVFRPGAVPDEGDPVLAAMLAGGIVLLDSDGNYLMDETGAVLYASDELFTMADGSAFATADGVLYGVPA
jgi:hypothetical protein